jgi:hypothetical protein
LLIALGYVSMFIYDFVVPIMRERQIGVLAGWGEFRRLFDRNPGFFVIYGLLKFGLSTGVWGALVTVLVLTCCCCCVGGLALAIPYVGTVLLLPIHVFFRAMGPEFLAELRSRDRGVTTQDSPPAAGDDPIVVV